MRTPDSPDPQFAFGGEIVLSSQPQGKSGKVGFDKVGGQLDFTITEMDGTLDVERLGFTLDENFQLFGLEVKTLNGFGFEYNLTRVSGRSAAGWRPISGGTRSGCRSAPPTPPPG